MRPDGSAGDTSMEYDVIVVGAGSAGAPAAALLSARPSQRVLLLEAGDDYRSADTHPAIRGPNFAAAIGLGKYHWPELQARVTNQQPAALYLNGRGVGGSSAINGQGAVRGLPADFDRWARNGCAGWSWTDVLPTLVQLECDVDFGACAYHGADGPIPISRVAYSSWGSVSQAMTETAIGCGHSWSDDLNAPGSTGISPIPWNRLENGRVSTNDAYLEPARHRANLTVRGNTVVERILFDGTRVTGVEARGAAGSCLFRAAEVVLCAGALHSPALLLRSGIGSADELRQLGIRVIADLRGVGRNLQDHPMVWLTFALAPDVRASSTETLPGHCVLRFSVDGAAAGSDACTVMPLERTPMEATCGGLMIAVMRPASRGSIRLASGDPAAEPVVEFNMLSNPGDLAALGEATRHAAALLNSSAGARVMEGPIRFASGDPLDDGDDRRLAALLRHNCVPHFHAAGTCRMGSSRDRGAVVDTRGRVIGVEGLRVVDASIIPDLPAAPLHLTAVMIAEHIFRGPLN